MNLDTVLTLFVLPHVVAGTVALALFWMAAVLQKGSPLHRRVGQGYLLAMLAIILTAIPLVILTWMRGHPVTAIFLGYLTLLIALTCRNAWCAIRFRRDPARFAGLDMQVLATTTGLAGIIVVIMGLTRQAWILVAFGMIGPLILLQLAKQRRARKRGQALASNWWLKEHYGAMIANGVATHIAFFQIGLMRLLPGLETALLQQMAWFGPLMIALLAGRWLDRRYSQWPRARQTGTS
ncbi:hypothetical protein [Wenzhouxiangella limi]|uniref:DUF2306 domain-containing protein n=1 Tax=Wenzhouxiangella limi TaxID=2707351 RepID=A0A845UYP9_9GAMM|nr:hypothetical protein [Wenzhouxiangella limi]NDY95848.1 hypothetical protein [Wenzhouxiangella limi]